MKTIIFVCVHNAGRSQMAAALLNAAAVQGTKQAKGTKHEGTKNEGTKHEGVRAMSAGTEPAEGVHPELVEVMREIGIDLSQARPQKLTPELAQQADLLITMGCGDKCPYVPGLKTEDWPLEDPKGKPLAEVRRIRDDIRCRIDRLLSQL
jgi:arsenate reductase